MPTYEIHDNGGRPFTVEINGLRVSVFKNMDEYELQGKQFVTIPKPRKHLFDFTANEVFLGKKSPTGGYDGLKPKDAEGNSILLHVGEKYVYIGSEIYEFSLRAGDTIEKYYSDIGNSDVPYPYAVGRTHVYIMLDEVAVEKSFFDMKKDIYRQYYDGTDALPQYMARLTKDQKEQAKDRIAELETKSKKMRTKQLQKRGF
jgi:hypothetical protein